MRARLIVVGIFLLVTQLCFAQAVVVDSVVYGDGFRTVRLLLPEGYKKSAHPLLIMMDGQNLFDDATSYVGEWQVDESISKLPPSRQPVVIAVDHGNDKRIDELTPYTHEKYGGGGGMKFLTWLKDAAIPEIIIKYEIQPREDIAIAGSSLGGLFAHYAAVTHPEYFKTAGVLSPSYWYSESIYDLTADSNFKSPQHFWISGGTAEDETLFQKMEKMRDILTTKKHVQVELRTYPDAQHNEAQWRQAFPDFLEWWLKL